MRAQPAEVCLLCGSLGTPLYASLSDQLFGVKGEWAVRQCSNPACELAWLDPKPKTEDLHLAYSHYYTHADHTSETSTFDNVPRQLVRRLERLWLVLLGLSRERRDIEVLFLNRLSPGRVLEVGCGDGSRMDALQQLGWTVEGQEVDPVSAAEATKRGFPVHVGTLEELNLPDACYDAVVMNHVLEHVPDPVEVLGQCRRILKPGGSFVATTPNSSSYGHDRFGRTWIGLDVPRHLHLFNPVAADRLAKQAGFSRREASTSPARAGGLLAASREIGRGGHQMRGRMSTTLVLSASWYQLTARIAYARRDGSGEETVLRAFR